jgi:hypothetical protein
VSQYGGSERVLYNEDDLEKSMDKIEVNVLIFKKNPTKI